jgi:hypothetical protein
MKASGRHEVLPILQARRADRKMNNGSGKLAPNGPSRAPITEVALLELPGGRPSSGHVSPTNDRTPVSPSVHCRSNADGLVGRAGNHNLKAIADLEIGASGTGRIRELHYRLLGGNGNGSDHQNE